eukprot:73984-Pelagomonas_calceolata.AAC.1
MASSRLVRALILAQEHNFSVDFMQSWNMNIYLNILTDKLSIPLHSKRMKRKATQVRSSCVHRGP